MVKLNSLIKYSSVILISFLNFYVMYLIHYDNFWILLDASFDVLTVLHIGVVTKVGY